MVEWCETIYKQKGYKMTHTELKHYLKDYPAYVALTVMQLLEGKVKYNAVKQRRDRANKKGDTIAAIENIVAQMVYKDIKEEGTL